MFGKRNACSEREPRRSGVSVIVGASWSLGWRRSLALGVLGGTASSLAFEARDLLAFRAGPFAFRPRFSVAEQYTDNVFYRGGDGQLDDFITFVTPGLNIHLGTPGTQYDVVFDYSFNQYWYTQNPDIIETATSHSLSLSGLLQTDRLHSTTSLSYSISDTVYGGYESFEQGGAAGRANLERSTYTLSESLGYDIGNKSDAYANFNLSGTDFQEQASLFDVGRWRVTGGFGQAVTAKLRASAEAFYGQDEQTGNLTGSLGGTMHSIGGSLGVNTRITGKLGGSIRLGYQESWWDTRLDAVDDSLDDGGMIGSVSLSYQFSPKTSGTLGYSRSMNASVQSVASSYTSDRVNVGLQKAVGTSRPFLFTVGGSYGHNAYETGILTNRATDYFSVNFGVGWQPKSWIRTSLAYQFQQTVDSNDFAVGDSAIDYVVNTVTLSVAFGF